MSLRRDPDHVPLFLVRYEDGNAYLSSMAVSIGQAHACSTFMAVSAVPSSLTRQALSFQDDEDVFEEELEQMRSAERKAEAAAAASSALNTPRKVFGHLQY